MDVQLPTTTSLNTCNQTTLSKGNCEFFSTTSDENTFTILAVLSVLFIQGKRGKQQ